MKFNRENCKVLLLVRNNPGHLYTLGVTKLRREGAGCPGRHQADRDQQRALGAKAAAGRAWAAGA